MKKKAKFLLLPNGGIIEKTAIVSVIPHDAGKTFPPHVAIQFKAGAVSFYASQYCKNNKERDELIIRIRKEIGE